MVVMFSFSALGRLRPGVSPEQAATEARTILQRGMGDFLPEGENPPRDGPEIDVRVVPLLDETVGEYRPALLALTAAMALVLLIACVNVAGLLFARGVSRQRALAVGAALGAGRSRLVRQLLTESMALSVGGGVLGLAAAAVVLAVAVAFLPTGFYLGSYYEETERLIFYKEGVETTVAVLEVPEDDFKISFVNGRDEVPTDRASMAAFRLLGHLPPLIRPGARNALVLSFGNGIATGTLDTHRIPVIDAVDLSPEMIEAAAVYSEENYDVLESERLRLHVEDGRNFLLRTEDRYDIITVDATHPANASSWALFTSEFYQLVERHLAEDGVFMQWIPLHGVRESDYRDILRTVWDVFPEMVLWSTGSTHSYVVATREPMSAVVMQSILARAAANPTVVRDLGSPETISGYIAMAGPQLTRYIGRGPVITDNNAFFMPGRD